MPALLLLDMLDIQGFIFRSNRLAMIRDASDCIVSLAEKAEEGFSDEFLIDGGGNLLFKYDNEESAKSAAATFSRMVCDEAPSLALKGVIQSYDEGGMADALGRVFAAMDKSKRERTGSGPLQGLSVTRACKETGLPVAVQDLKKWDPAAPYSRSVAAASATNHGRWKKRLECCIQDNSSVANHLKELKIDAKALAFPIDNDDLGRTIGEKSLLGIVHIDINGLGTRMNNWITASQGNPDEDVVKHIKEWSDAIWKTGEDLYQAVFAQLLLSLKETEEGFGVAGFPEELSFNIAQKDATQVFLPIRPLVLGGDDLTFMCDARIALSLAVAALRALGSAHIKHLYAEEEPPTACAGVALLHAHAPFWRGYTRAHALCHNAKEWLLHHGVANQSAIDWELATGAAGTERRLDILSDLQDSQSMRPYPLAAVENRNPGWEWFDTELLGEGDNSLRHGAWGTARNKVKRLRQEFTMRPELLPETVESWRLTTDQNLGFPKPVDPGGTVGTCGGRSPLLDASEILDIHLSLANRE